MGGKRTQCSPEVRYFRSSAALKLKQKGCSASSDHQRLVAVESEFSLIQVYGRFWLQKHFFSQKRSTFLIIVTTDKIKNLNIVFMCAVHVG